MLSARCRRLPALLLLALFGAFAGCGGHRPAVPSGAAPAPPPSPIRFVNVVPTCGISFQSPPLPIPLGTKEAFGTGCAFLDYDGDGLMDVLLVAAPHALLYRNLGNGRFADVTRAVGLDQVTGDWRGCAVGDYDGDGRLDLLLTGFHRIALLRNLPSGRAGGRFVDATRTAGLDPSNGGHWASSAGFMGLSGSGRLDLVILNYLSFGPKTPDFCELAPGVRSGCPPTSYQAELPEVWQNVGGGRFQDVSAASGIRAAHGKALVLAFMDLGGKGRPDVFIGNDGQPADLMQNQTQNQTQNQGGAGGAIKFRDAGVLSGLDSAADGSPVSAMGADWADYDRDGRMDLVVTNFSSKPFQLYRGLGAGVFEHRENAVGLAAPTFQALGFGAKWADVDNDGWPDILFANGHVYDDPGRLDGFSHFRQPLMLFHNENGTHFTDIAPAQGGDLARPILGRGLASGDFDNDGRMDFLVVDHGGRPLLLHNLTPSTDHGVTNHWITFDLRARAPNVFAYGARLTARAAGRVWVGFVSPASSYLSSSDPRLHFGLGPVTALDSVQVDWPDGQQQTLHAVRADRILRVQEGNRP